MMASVAHARSFALLGPPQLTERALPLPAGMGTIGSLSAASASGRDARPFKSSSEKCLVSDSTDDQEVIDAHGLRRLLRRRLPRPARRGRKCEREQ